MSSTLETNAVRAKSAYRQTLQDFIAPESTSATARWDMDRYDFFINKNHLLTHNEKYYIKLFEY
jgi:hypothetical protein